MTKKQKLIAYIISGLCIACLAVAFILWGSDEPKTVGFYSSIICIVLFSVLGVCFMEKWIPDWCRKTCITDYKKAAGKVKFPEMFTVSVVTLFIQLMSFLLLAVFIKAFKGEQSFIDGLSTYLYKPDSQHYLEIAKNFYITDDPIKKLTLVFLPGFPALVKLFNLVINDYSVSAVITANVFLNIGICYLYALLRLDQSKEDAGRTMVYFALMPGAFFLIFPMSESVFLMTSAACIYYLRKKNYPLVFLFGAYATFTRTLGLALLAPVLYEYISGLINDSPKSKKEVVKSVFRGFLCIGIVLGFAGYLLINKIVAGDAFKFLEYQHSNWNQGLDWFFNTADYLADYGVKYYGSGSASLYGLTFPNLFAIFSSLIIIALAVKKGLRPSYAAYYIMIFVMAVGTTWLLSLPRYYTTVFTIPLALSTIFKDKRAEECAAIGFMGAYSIVYLIMFVLRWQVW